MVIRAAVFGLLLSMPLAAGFFFYERLFPDEIKTLVEKGDQSLKDPAGGDSAEICFKQAIALGLHGNIDSDRQAMLYDRLAYYYLRQAKAYQANQANQTKDKQALAQGIVSKQFARAIEQYKIALKEAQKSQNPLRIATENLGVADSLQADSAPEEAAPYYQDCVKWAKSIHPRGDEILGAALLGQATNLHRMSRYRDAITTL
jgi:hypothetical protein